MSIASYCSTPACTATPDESIRAAAQRMEKAGIGLLAVTEHGRLVGVLTDRDVALHVVAEGRDPAVARIRDAMSRPPVGIAGDASLKDALGQMASHRVRRLPVADGARLEGVISADDLALLVAREIDGLADVIQAQLPAGGSDAVGREAPQRRPRRAAQHYRGDVVSTAEAAPIAEVAREMQRRVVGSVVVISAGGEAVGLVTDRDVALRVVAAGRDPAATSASEIMSTPLTSASPSDSLEEVIARMRTAKVRRIPILESGRAVGMVTLDDLLVALAHELEQLASCLTGEIRRERIRSYSSWLREELEERIDDAAVRLRDVGDQTLRTLRRELDQVVDRIGQAVRGGAVRPRVSHPSVRDLMRSEVRTCTPEDALSEPARIMWERDCGCVPVLASDGSGRVVGMITDRDICMAAHTSGARLAEMQVKNVMSKRVYSCHPDESISEAEAIMRSTQVRRLPVVDSGGHLRGMLALADIAEAAAGIRVPVGTVSASEVGVLLESICRPRSELVRG